MRLGCRYLIAIFLLLTHAAAPARANEETTYQIRRLEGTSQVEVERAGKNLRLARGDVLREGDEVRLKAREIIEIVSEERSELVVTGPAKLRITHDSSAFHALKLLTGRLVGLVRKSARELGRDKKFNYVIEANNAVMGVRGTQFVVETSEESKKSTFHIIEGVVDIAKDFTGLLTDNFVVAKTGELVAAAGEQVGVVVDTAANVTSETARTAKTVVHGVTDTVTSGVKTISKAMPFDVLGFVANMNDQLPEWSHIPFITGTDRKYGETESRYHLSSFEIYGQSYFSRVSTPDNGSYFGGGLSWNPTWHIAPERFDVRAHIGNSRLFQGGHGLFGDVEAKLLGTAIVKRAAFFDLGPVLRHYYSSGNGFGIAADTGIWLGDRRLVHLFDRFIFGVNFIGVPNKAMAWEYRFGVGVTIF